MPLRSAISTPDGKRQYVRRLFATIADRYDFITRFLSYGQDRRWKRLLILRAALQPAKTPALYYVARGDGSSEFSRTLEEHNRAVRKYQLNGGRN